MKMMVTNKTADLLFQQISSVRFQDEKMERWKVDENGTISPWSVFWLFCWCTDTSLSRANRDQIVELFNILFGNSYSYFESSIWSLFNSILQKDQIVNYQPVINGNTQLISTPHSSKTLNTQPTPGYFLRMVISPSEALSCLKKIPHKYCQQALSRNWSVDKDGQIKAQNLLWLFCWAKTGLGSYEAAEASKKAIELIFGKPFEWFDQRIPHEYARSNRRAKGNINKEFDSLLNNYNPSHESKQDSLVIRIK